MKPKHKHVGAGEKQAKLNHNTTYQSMKHEQEIKYQIISVDTQRHNSWAYRAHVAKDKTKKVTPMTRSAGHVRSTFKVR